MSLDSLWVRPVTLPETKREVRSHRLTMPQQNRTVLVFGDDYRATRPQTPHGNKRRTVLFAQVVFLTPPSLIDSASSPLSWKQGQTQDNPEGVWSRDPGSFVKLRQTNRLRCHQRAAQAARTLKVAGTPGGVDRKHTHTHTHTHKDDRQNTDIKLAEHSFFFRQGVEKMSYDYLLGFLRFGR